MVPTEEMRVVKREWEKRNKAHLKLDLQPWFGPYLPRLNGPISYFHVDHSLSLFKTHTHGLNNLSTTN